GNRARRPRASHSHQPRRQRARQDGELRSGRSLLPLADARSDRMTGRILVVNTGSSSVKFSLYDAAADDLAAEAHGELEGIGVRPRLHIRAPGGTSLVERDCQAGEAADQEGAIATIVAWVDDHLAGAPLAGVGHRVVHGGETFTEPVRVTDEVLAAL